ncbi:hypothetical protein COS78_00895 [Candidatus Shapirobacteria bacterium CG06_land_8_20_14_3_00_40_12]|uniref:Major facilitator superfamily (MFS) profile domain-containing protein n=2 Tax=Candidatus Shapironibacteriota TaxID=1752721 RepID=A0A2M7TRW7_9BACT|nr:MAG: hypothetical protein COS78_00895 [Candidatus Shapirobacteria bacterium CG06_land_8_20_14_3_00_40_12]PIZ58194.1 MAG: hypothetical protein COY20_04050 [Candidatus Shapirobacteria bacterium CG_4_10_14_0_2_um_filter_40_12]
MFIFAHSLLAFCVGFALMAVSDALMSGTDEAMIYDTNKALGDEKNSLSNLGKYFSAKRIFKIITPLLAVLIAGNLRDEQFVTLLIIDSLAGIAAIILGLFLTEPEHYLKIEKMEAGVFKDAINIFKKNPELLRVITGKVLFFMANFAIWRISSEMFRNNGVAVIMIGVANSLYSLVVFFVNRLTGKLGMGEKIYIWINRFGDLTLGCILLMAVNQIWWKNGYLGLGLFCGVVIFESSRWPLFSELFNRVSHSYNRATVLSLSNLLKSILEIPTMLLCAIFVGWGYQYLLLWCGGLALTATIFFRVKNNPEEKVISNQAF